LNNIMGKEK